MAFFVPCSSGFQDATKDPLSARYLKIWVDTDGDGDLEDVTSYFDNNKLSGGGSGQGELGVSTKQYTVQLRNSALGLVDGDWAGRKCAIEAKVGTAEYITIFTGIVSEEGAQRDKRSVTEDTVTFTMQDASASRGMKRKAKPVNYINHKICDTATPSTSLFHKLAYQLGLADADLETATINQTKDYLPLDGKREVWQELQDLCAQYIGHMCFRYDGKLRFISRHQQGWAEPTSEWIFDADNIHPWRGKSTGISCNRCKTEFEKYENLGQRTIYKNTDEWDGTNNRNNIPVVAGAYWPGPAAEDKAQLHYKDPASGESWPIGISIQTSTIGAVGSGSDIECEGGLLTLISFNGSTSATQQNPGNSEIILRNNTGSTITIRKFELRGAPLRIRAKIVVEDIDATVTDDWEWVDKTIPGKYAVSDTQAHVSTQRWVEFGKVKRKLFDFETYWIPQIQDGAVVTFHPNDSINISAVVESYTHDCGGSPRKWKTRLSIREKESFTPSGSALVITQAQGEASTEIAEEFVTHQEAISGFDDAPSGGTKTPTQPTIALCKSSSYRSITIGWDKQLNLTNLDRYELQVSADQANWYSLRFDGVDWKAQLGGVTPWPAESIVHTLIPFGGSIEVPTALTLYYQARRVTKAEVTSNWSITASATVSPVAAGDVAAYQLTAYKLDGYARSQHGVFLEVFEVAPSEWNNRNGSGTESVVADVGVCGGKAYQTAGYRWRAFQSNIPFDPSKQYRIRCRVRRTATTDAAKQMFYCGVEGVAANGTTLVNINGADSFASQHYIAAANENGSTWTLNEWQTFTGWFKGTAATGEDTEHPNGNDPAALHDNVRYIRPLFIMNYDTGPAGNVLQLDYIAIDVFDEDELFRTYAGLNIDGTVAANKVVAASLLAEAVVAGKIAASAVDTDQLAAGAVTADKIEGNTITANEIVAAFLSGAFAKFTGELVVGQDYTGSPPAGAQRIVIDGNELRLDEYNGSAWVVIFRIGGDDILKWYLQARGLIKTGADISGLEIGYLAANGARIFRFEDNCQDHLGVDPFTTKTNIAYTSAGKFKKAITKNTVAAAEIYTASGFFILGTSFSFSLWIKVSDVGTAGDCFIATLLTGAANDNVRLIKNGSTVKLFIRKNLTDTTYTISSCLVAGQWHFISVSYDLSTNTAALRVDLNTTGGNPSGSWLGESSNLHLYFYPVTLTTTFITDDFMWISSYYSAASFLSYYQSGQPWVDATSGIDALLDLVLMAKAGGKIKALSTFEAPGLDSDWGWLFPSRKTKALDLSWSAAVSNRIIYCKNLNVTASMTLTGNIIVCEGNLTIAANQTLTIVRGGWNTGVGAAGGLGLVPSQSGAGAIGVGVGTWGGGNGGGAAPCWGGGGSLCRAGGAGGTGSAPGGVAHTGAFAIGGAGGAGWGSGPQYGGGGGAGPGGAGGGSTGAGGSGGGAIWIFVKGNFTINSGAMIACDGANGVQGGGGGAGGLVVIVVLGTFTNSGSITAKGGNGIIYGNGSGGGGGGGHIEIYADPVSTFGTLTVTGGSGYAAGGTGTTQTNDLGTNPSDSLGGLASSALAGIGLQLCPRVAI